MGARLVRDAWHFPGQSRSLEITSTKLRISPLHRIMSLPTTFCIRKSPGSRNVVSSKNAPSKRTQGILFQVQNVFVDPIGYRLMQDLTATSGVKSWSCSLQLKLPLTPNTRCKTIIRRLVGLRHWYRLTSLGPMSWTLKRSLWIASSDRYPVSFNKEDRERSTSLSRRPARPFLRRPSTNGVTLQTTSGATVTNLAVCAIPEVPRVRTRSRSQDALIPWRQPRRHSFSGSQGPGISTMNHALPLFQTSRGHQRGMGINSGLLPMEIPDLSLRNTFSPPLLKDRPDRPKTSTCSMCNYTYVHLECGHRVDDVADLRDCPYFEEHGRMPCDPNDPANRGRVSIKAESRPGICNTCRRRQQEVEEMEALRRDEEGAERESLSEAKQSEKTAKAHEEKLLIESREDFERQRRKGEQEDEDMEYMPQRSREEAEAGQVQQKQDDLAKVLEASCVNLHGDPKVCCQYFKSSNSVPIVLTMASRQ